MSQDPTADAVAMDWALRMADPARADWDGFTDWLEADPCHAERYDRMTVTLLDAEAALAAHPDVMTAPEPPTVEAVAASRRGALRWIGGAVAAALVATVGVTVWQDRPQPYAVETAAGEMRDVALPDGSTITLAGNSRIELDHVDSRRAVMARGEALFRIRHDDRRPFAVWAGSLALVDLGTVFDVRLGRERTRVAVAEGAVMVDPKGVALRLNAGQAVVVSPAAMIRERTTPADVGDWRNARLAFDGAPLGDVAEDLSRFLPQPIIVAPAIAARPFRGTIDLNAVRRDPQMLAPLMDVTVRRVAAGWMLGPRR